MRRALAGIVAVPLLATGIARCGSAYDVIATAPPKLFVDRHAVEPKHDIPVLRLTLPIHTNYRIVAFSATATIQKWVYVRHGLRRVLEAHTIAAFHRGLTDLPPPGDSLTWTFPETGKPHNEHLIKCINGRYFSRIRVQLTGTNGVPLSYTLFYPYDITKSSFAHAPSPRRSWQVSCKRYGQVPDPAGE